MANKFRNEKVVKLGEVEILLRPTFENCANLESSLGYGLPMMAFKLAKQQLPSMTDSAKVIFFCQAEKKYTLEQIWDLLMIEGSSVMKDLLVFVGGITAGDKTVQELTENQKKS